MKVAIIYGWAEGPLVGRQLRRSLHAAGHTVTTKAEDADVIIAHSGGCFLLPARTSARVIILVGLPYWPERHPLANLPRKIIQDMRTAGWLQKTLANSYYLVTRPDRWLKMWRNWEKAMYPSYDLATIITVRNESDVFQNPVELAKFAFNQGWHTHFLPGEHDDLWSNPQPYVELINKAAAEAGLTKASAATS